MLAALTLTVLALVAATRPLFVGDAPFYESEIVQALRTGNLGALFEAGHLLWRPFGLLNTRFVLAMAPGSDPRFAAHLGLLIPNYVAGLFTALLFYRIARAVSAPEGFAAIIALALAASNAFLNYAASGSAYVAGLLPLSAACLLLLTCNGRYGAARIAAAGACASVAILLWLPFITVLPGLLAIPIVYSEEPGKRAAIRSGLLAALQIGAVAAGLAGAVYVAAFFARGFSTPADFRAWLMESKHGWHQSSNLVRFVFGLPRGFLALGNDGIAFKRYLWHDPYAAVTLGELLRTAVAPLALFYLFLAAVAAGLWRGRHWRPGVVLGAAAAPVFVFAVFLFEPGSPERYLPLYPFLAAAVPLGIAGAGGRSARFAMVGVLAAASLSLAWKQSVWNVERQDRPLVDALSAVRPALDEHSQLWVLVLPDPVISFAGRRPFHPLNLPRPVPARVLVAAGTENAAHWGRDFSAASLHALDEHGADWISAEFLEPRPRRDGSWTEGDIRGVRWRDIQAFFSRLEYARRIPGPSGFAMLADTPGNRRELALASGSGKV
jgi:hypothetical protein